MERNEKLLIFDSVLKRTGRAQYLKFGDDCVWIPESLIKWIDEQAGEVLLPSWLVYEKCLENYEK